MFALEFCRGTDLKQQHQHTVRLKATELHVCITGTKIQRACTVEITFICRSMKGKHIQITGNIKHTNVLTFLYQCLYNYQCAYKQI